MKSEVQVSTGYSELRSSVEAVDAAQSLKKAKSKVIPGRTALHARYQFDSFVVGPHNSLAFAAAQAVAERPGELYNPLLIQGASGLGKTHLLQAVGNRIRELNPQARIVYQSADRFVHEFITAIRFDKAAAFEQRYREVDVLLIDDLQFIARKEQTQEAFFHIFNALQESGKQIVLSSDTIPNNIEGLAQRIRSRLEGALITPISKLYQRWKPRLKYFTKKLTPKKRF